MAAGIVPHLANDQGVEKIFVGVRELQCMGARPPFDHPHIFIDMGADTQALCPYCSTLFIYDARLAPDETDPKGASCTAWRRPVPARARPVAVRPVAASADDILIAGGGLGGLATALALARLGRASRILERNPAFSEAGAGIQIGPNGMRVLELLGADRTRASPSSRSRSGSSTD